MKQLKDYSAPLIHDVETILSENKYYENQLPSSLEEQIYDYIDLVKNLDKKEHYARKAVERIIFKNVSEYLETSLLESDKVRIEFQAVREDGFVDLYEIRTLLLKGQTSNSI